MCFGLSLVFVPASFSSSFSLIELYIDFDGRFSSLAFVRPRLADSAAPAARCWACDFAGMLVAPFAFASRRRARRRRALAEGS
ncbi:hypothetical protein DP56_5977 [Burkholderia pseudomallei]|nr:hypothetical protein DP56_5977 [Burkholderia pseudomallei]